MGRGEWRKESGYRQQTRVENGIFRSKSVLGGRLKARDSKAQRRGAMIRCHILNRMAELGKPNSDAAVSGTTGRASGPTRAQTESCNNTVPSRNSGKVSRRERYA